MAKFIELSSGDETYLVNVDKVALVVPDAKGSVLYTTCDKRPVAWSDQSYERVKELILNASE